MSRFLFLVVTLISTNCAIAQVDTVNCKSVKGFIFLPAYHSAYDKCCPGEMSPGYNDYFFPVNSPNIELFKEQNMDLVFRNCLRVEKNNFRAQIKKQAFPIKCIDTNLNTHWYYLDSFFVIPVVTDYKVFADDFPKMMSQDSFEVQVKGGARIFFYPERKALVPLRIQILKKNRSA